MGSLDLRPKAFANQPRVGAQRQPWITITFRLNPERVRRERFSVLEIFYLLIPGLSLRSNPGLQLANAFGVISRRACGRRSGCPNS